MLPLAILFLRISCAQPISQGHCEWAGNTYVAAIKCVFVSRARVVVNVAPMALINRFM